LSKKEKYINYIVDDLIKTTIIHYDQKIIEFPFTPYLSHRLLTNGYGYLHSPLFTLHPDDILKVKNHLMGRYGLGEKEMSGVWETYRQQMKSIIGNE
jgi:hypothetical protein